MLTYGSSSAGHAQPQVWDACDLKLASLWQIKITDEEKEDWNGYIWLIIRYESVIPKASCGGARDPEYKLLRAQPTNQRARGEMLE
ncbi:unnamed protein product [Dibothriocephalus latus]|uniref:Uncharacterized protein n=1 Tax=Dibothriocephalus latus TaxID=60516 RepID=A0A3P7R2J3_DIBLA|nr:unnamed protein product [Dibothriocephalus latus]